MFCWHVVDVGASSFLIPSNGARKMLDGAVLGTQLGTPRGRYDKHNNKFLSVVKPRFIEPVGESQTSQGDAC
jgi:hypothetical protein